MFAVAANNVPSGLVDLFHGIQVRDARNRGTRAQLVYCSLNRSSIPFYFIPTGRSNAGVDDQHFTVCLVEGQLLAVFHDAFFIPYIYLSLL